MPSVRLLEVRNTYKWGGGPDKTILLSAEQHNRSRVSVVVAYIRDARDREFRISEKARTCRLTYYEIEERGKFDPRVIWALRDLVLQHDINLIHSHDYKSDLFAYLVRKLCWRKHIVLLSTAHGWALVGPRGNLYRRLDMSLMRRFDHLIAVSHATKKQMVTDGVPECLISVIHNAIDIDAWSPTHSPGDLRSKLNLSWAFPVVGYVGRLTEEKDLDVWLRAAAYLSKQYSRAHFVLVGEGRDEGLREELQKLAVSLKMSDHVTFLGYQENVLPIYSTFDIFLLSSRREGLCNSILEAMSLGLPIVSTDCGGSKELVVDGHTGFLLKQRDVNGLARALVALADDDQLRALMGRAGRERVEQEFSFRHRLQRIEDLYESILGVGPKRASAPDVVGQPV